MRVIEDRAGPVNRRRRRRCEYDVEVELAVRDYECDLQGVVNHAVYLHYLEHARHLFLRRAGIDFVRLHEQGCDLVLTRAEVDYIAPLRPGDAFVVCTSLEPDRPSRFAFEQAIFRLPDEERVVRARMVGTGVIGGRAGLPPELEARLTRAAGAAP